MYGWPKLPGPPCVHIEMYKISASNNSGRVTFTRMSAASAVKKAQEFIEANYWDVQIACPKGHVYLPEQFGYL